MKYLSANEYYKKIFGHKVYKISLDAGCTCPTRDGTKSTKGCIFCSPQGSGEFCSDRNLSITDQIEQAKNLVQKKIKNLSNVQSKYIAYFQNFTNTYGDENLLIQKYLDALSNPEIVGIAIGTRPDCLSDSMLEKINLLSKKDFPLEHSFGKKYFSIEFGLQSSKDSTCKYINRLYENSEYVDAINRVKKVNKNIHIVSHIIFGLPGESKEDMLNSVNFALASGTDGLKFQVLNVLTGTELEKEYLLSKFKVLEMGEYFEIIKSALKIVPSNVVIHRLTGDGPKKLLIAPKWVSDKKRVLCEILKLQAE